MDAEEMRPLLEIITMDEVDLEKGLPLDAPVDSKERFATVVSRLLIIGVLLIGCILGSLFMSPIRRVWKPRRQSERDKLLV